MNKYIILEIIPTSTNPQKGDIIQLSALKIDTLKIIDRFDYRLNENKIAFKKMLDLVDYDKDKFIYKNDSIEIINDFKKWIDDYPLLIIDNNYTENYLSEIPNQKESVFNKLNLSYHDEIIERIIEKYQLEPSNYIVDLLYEALLYENDKK